MSVLFIQILPGVGKDPEFAFDAKARCPLVEARYPTRVVSLLNRKRTRLVLVKTSIRCFVKVTQVAQKTQHAPAILSVLLGRDRFDGVTCEISKVGRPQALALIGTKVGVES